MNCDANLTINCPEGVWNWAYEKRRCSNVIAFFEDAMEVYKKLLSSG